MNVKNADFRLKNTDTSTDQAKTRPQDTLEYKLTKSWDNFPLKPQLKIEEEKYTIALFNSEVYISFFNITEHDKYSQHIHRDKGKILILLKF